MILISGRLTPVNSAHLPGTSWRKRQAFTLVELLVVMAIIVMLMAVAMPALRGMLSSYHLTGSADNLAAQFSLARQTAMSRNLPVEARFYNAGSASAPVWNSLALVIPAVISGKTADEWISKAATFSGNVIIDAGRSGQTGLPYSTLLTPSGAPAPTTSAPNSTAPWTSQEPTTAPASVKGLNYVAFRFQPDGSTNLVIQDAAGQRTPWSLCLRNSEAPPARNGIGPATNYAALVVDPATGRILTFRP